jgi:hypothetical protein
LYRVDEEIREDPEVKTEMEKEKPDKETQKNEANLVKIKM